MAKDTIVKTPKTPEEKKKMMIKGAITTAAAIVVIILDNVSGLNWIKDIFVYLQDFLTAVNG